MEYWYGFSAFRYILQKLNELDKNTLLFQERKDFNLGHFNGSPFISLCSTMLENRLLFSKAFFLDYAIGATLRSQDLKSNYLTYDSSVGMSLFASDDTSSTENKISRALQSIRQFLDAVNHITVPLLEDIWSITMSKVLNEDIISHYGNDISLIYKIYIDDNMDILTADFTLFNDEDFSKCIRTTNDSTSPTSNGISTKFNIEELKKRIQAQTENVTLKNIDSKPFIRETFIQLLYEYLSIEHSRFRETDVLPGYINHPMGSENSYQLKLKDYFQDIILKRIALCGEGHPDC